MLFGDCHKTTWGSNLGLQLGWPPFVKPSGFFTTFGPLVFTLKIQRSVAATSSTAAVWRRRCALGYVSKLGDLKRKQFGWWFLPYHTIERTRTLFQIAWNCKTTNQIDASVNHVPQLEIRWHFGRYNPKFGSTCSSCKETTVSFPHFPFEQLRDGSLGRNADVMPCGRPTWEHTIRW